MSNIIFFGSDQYATIVLSQLLASQTNLTIIVVTDRPKPVGIHQVITSSKVEVLAKTHNLKIFYYPDFDHTLITKDTLGLCASFDHLIPAEIINLFAGNLYNLHPSLLPQYRNVSPVQYAIALGDTATGVTLFRITSGIDNGEIIAQASAPILPTDTTSSLTPRLFDLGAEIFLQRTVLCKPHEINKEPFFVKPTKPLIFTRRLTRESGFIEWPLLQTLLANTRVKPSSSTNKLLNLQPTPSLDHLLRALTPWPGVWSTVPTKKGELRITLETNQDQIMIKLAGKPHPIRYADFQKYYL